jgi:hypothetical protein
MGRVERGELEFRPGKHLDPLCRYLRVPRWWFTADELDFGGVEAPASPDEVASLLAQHNALLAEQSAVLHDIRDAVAEQRAIKDELAYFRRLNEEIVHGRPEEAPASPLAPQRPSAAGK